MDNSIIWIMILRGELYNIDNYIIIGLIRTVYFDNPS